MYSGLEGKTLHIFSWTIKNLKACTLKHGEFLVSPIFKAKSFDETSWQIRLFPEGEKHATKEFISCSFRRSIDCAGPDVVECDYTIEAIDKNNKSLKKCELTRKFRKDAGFCFFKFIEKNSVNACSYDSLLTIIVNLRKKLPKVSKKSSCCTEIATEHFSFKWNVKNSNSSDVNIKTVSFTKNLQLKITVEIPEDDVEISIRRIKGFVGSQKLICCVTLLDSQAEEADSKEAILEADNPDDDDTWKFPLFLKKSKITAQKDKYLEEDCFTLKFDFYLSVGKTDSTEDLEQSLMSKKDFSASLKTDLKRVLNDNIHTDIELHADEKVFRAHKVILCARSPVFLAMFNQNMIEKQSGAIIISDIESETLNSLLEFMYTGDTEMKTCESALKLLLASDRYQVLSLKEKCSSALELFLSDENVCDILFSADLVQQESLKVCAVNYIKENSKIIFKSTEWQDLIEKNLKLASEIVSEMSTLLAA